jgi:hypothetical protein
MGGVLERPDAWRNARRSRRRVNVRKEAGLLTALEAAAVEFIAELGAVRACDCGRPPVNPLPKSPARDALTFRYRAGFGYYSVDPKRVLGLKAELDAIVRRNMEAMTRSRDLLDRIKAEQNRHSSRHRHLRG